MAIIDTLFALLSVTSCIYLKSHACSQYYLYRLLRWKNVAAIQFGSGPHMLRHMTFRLDQLTSVPAAWLI